MNANDSEIPSGDKIVSESRFVAASAERIFTILADPRRHHEIDGSGSVQAALEGAPQRLELGSTFGMSMKIGVPYRITNTVVEFEENRRIAWRHFGGHVWRFVLQPVDGGTMVTEQFDYRTSKSPIALKVAGYPGRNRESIKRTLEVLARRFGDG